MIYLGKCKKCRHASRADYADVQHLDSDRWARSATTGERVLVTEAGGSYDCSCGGANHGADHHG